MYRGEVYAPGTLLQILYFRQRMNQWRTGRFLEVGAGQGYLSKQLLQSDWTGTGLELNRDSIDLLNTSLQHSIRSGRYQAVNENFLEFNSSERFDLIFSSMVLEHLTDRDVDRYMEKSISLLSDEGRIVLIVPANKQAWGIEDELAGHLRRYDRQSIHQLAGQHGLKVEHIAGLTFPLSNILLPLSNRFVSRAECAKVDMQIQDRTVASGNRDVPFKTDYPAVMKYFLNEYTMYPLHMLQKCFTRSKRCLVLYAELNANE